MQPQQQPPEDSAAAAAAAAALAEPVTPQRTPRSPRLLLTWRRRKVHFPEHSPAPSDPDDPYDPLKVSAVVFGYPILTEREADYMLSQNVEPWKKLLFLLTNLPYTVMAVSSFFLTKVEHNAYANALVPLCESAQTYSFLAVCVACSSLLLHSSQVRVGHWCCSTARARTFHRRRVQDRLDVADCACAAVAVLGAVACQGINEIGPAMAMAVPVFAASLVAKKLQYHNLYLVLHGLWHLSTAATLWHVFVPHSSPLHVLLRALLD